MGNGNKDLCTKPLNANLSGLTIGSLSLTPSFDPDTTAYTAAATNATNTVTATAEKADSVISILNGETPVTNGTAATWVNGTNTLTITVTNGSDAKTYTVTVTKS